MEESFLLRLKELRTEKNVNQQVVAEMLGVTQATFSGWETGKYEIDNASLKKLSEYFSVSIDYLLDNEFLDNPAINPSAITNPAINPISKQLKILRKKSGMTQKDFADVFNIASATIGMWETDKREPAFNMLLKIAKYFDVTTDYLLGNEKESCPHISQSQRSRLPERLHKLRKSNEVTQEELAKNLHISRSSISMWETGDYQPDNEMLIKLADYFNVTTDYLLCYEKTPLNGKYISLKATDKDMEPIILEGDIVFIEKQNDIDFDSTITGAISVNSNISIKRIQKHKLGLLLSSYNTKSKPIFYTWQEVEDLPITIIGVVKELRRNL